MSNSAEDSAGSNRTHPLKKHNAQLEAEVRALRKQAQAQRQRIAQKCGYEFLALINDGFNIRITITDIVQKLVFQDEKGNTIFKTDSTLIGKIIEVRFKSALH